MKIIDSLTDKQVKELIEDLNTRLLPLVKLEGGVAKGRKHLWLKAQPDYKAKKYKTAHEDEFLWGVIKSIYPEAALAQIYWANGGNGIAWHRDAAFAKPKARILNLGKAIFSTWINPNGGGNQKHLELEGGEIIEFNCKELHRGDPIDDHRIGIAMWQDKISLKNKENWL